MEVIEVQTMQAEVTLRLVTVVREVFPGAVFAVEEIETFTHETGFMEPNWNWAEGSEQVDDIIEAVSSGCVKLVVRRPGWPAGALLAELQDQVSRNGPHHLFGPGLGRNGLSGDHQSPCGPARL